MHEAQKQPEDPWRKKSRAREEGACSGSPGWELNALPKSDSSQPGKENGASVDWVNGRVVGCGDLMNVALCLCWGSL